MVEIVVERTTNMTPDIVLNVHARILQQRLNVNLSKSGVHAVFFISIIYKQHFFQLVKFPKKISNKLVFWPEKKQHLQKVLSNCRLVKIMVFINNQ